MMTENKFRFNSGSFIPNTFDWRIDHVYIRGVNKAKNIIEEIFYHINGINLNKINNSTLLPGESKKFKNEWCRGKKFFIEDDSKISILTALNQVAPTAVESIIKEADYFLDHVFDLLGSGPVQLGNKIDWHVDFKTEHRWNPKTYYKRILPSSYPGGYDIKVPWELNRCHHFIRLGQAYWITGEEKYAHELVAQVEDWIESNPWPWGVNWACTMDVAIRVVNWLWAYYLIKDSKNLSDKFLISFYNSLLMHGRHIRKNLENYGGFTNNHYLANLVGLIFLGILFPDSKETVEWRDFGLHELWQEVFKQVYADGVNFEASIAYHRLATELLLSPIILCKLNNFQVPDEVMRRLEKMLEFVLNYIKPDGTIPLIGDADNGRLHRLKVWNNSEREWLDHRYLLAIGAILFERLDFARAAGDQWEDAIWLMGDNVINIINYIEETQEIGLPDFHSRIFINAGIFIMRKDDHYMIVNSGQSGQNGNGGHAHNDASSFELFTGGESWIVDSGTYVYTQDYNLRNVFRSTSYHNTVMVDDREINPINKKLIFQLKQEYNPIINKWISCDAYDFLDLEHYAYCSSIEPIVHRRQILFDKNEKIWLIQDKIDGSGKHQVDLNFHFLKSDIVILDDGLSLKLLSNKGNGIVLKFVKAHSLSLKIIYGWVSSSYGTLKPAVIAKYSGNIKIPFKITFCFFNPNTEIGGINREKIILEKYQKLMV